MTGSAFRPRPSRRDLYEGLDALAVSGAHVGPPPLLLGHRGAPREAPENTLAGLRRALELGLDGVEYDVRACASGDPVLLHDARLERTTDGTGTLADLDLRELFAVDAGGWFGRAFEGEGVPVLDEALGLTREVRGGPPFHMIELKERGLVGAVARLLGEQRPPVPARVASFNRDVCLDARDAGLSAMLLAPAATEDDRRFVRDERISAYGVGPGGWFTDAGHADWSFAECWAWSIDDPNELLALCRRPLFGLNTNEPHRALVARALHAMAPGADYPLEVPELYVEPETLPSRERGEWFGTWRTSVTLVNPFPFAVQARVSVFVPQGAFEIEGLPRVLDLAPSERRELPFELSGGARHPGPDPLVGALFEWRGGALLGAEVRAGGTLLFDAPLVRRRIATADGIARRLEMLAERPGDPPATVSARRARGDLLLSIENPGQLRDAHLVARIGGETVRGGGGLRLRLPAEFDDVPTGVPFSAGIEGIDARGEHRLRRWAGGLPEGLGHGQPGLLVPLGLG
ncbi:MAG: glycerophosphodiester phosphodiesterase family protein [Planctomycetota bacterium]